MKLSATFLVFFLSSTLFAEPHDASGGSRRPVAESGSGASKLDFDHLDEKGKKIVVYNLVKRIGDKLEHGGSLNSISSLERHPDALMWTDANSALNGLKELCFELGLVIGAINMLGVEAKKAGFSQDAVEAVADLGDGPGSYGHEIWNTCKKAFSDSGCFTAEEKEKKLSEYKGRLSAVIDNTRKLQKKLASAKQKLEVRPPKGKGSYFDF